MSISSILKFRMENDRKAAIALNRAVNGVEQNNRSVLGDVHSGLERASWYSSCFFDSYADICAQLKTEDKRFLKNIFEIYKRKDIIADIIGPVGAKLQNATFGFNDLYQKRFLQYLTLRQAGPLHC